MSEIDLDRLGDLWRAPSDPAEFEKLQRGAERVRRRARWGQLADFWLALLVSGVIIALALSNPKLKTGLFGAAVIVFMLYSTVRQRRLREIELKTLTGSTERMLDQSIRRAETTVKRARLSLVMAGPGLLLGVGFGAVLDDRSGRNAFERLTSDPWIAGLTTVAIFVALAGVSVHLWRASVRARREIEQLIQLRADYTDENRAE